MNKLTVRFTVIVVWNPERGQKQKTELESKWKTTVVLCLSALVAQAQVLWRSGQTRCHEARRIEISCRQARTKSGCGFWTFGYFVWCLADLIYPPKSIIHDYMNATPFHFSPDNKHPILFYVSSVFVRPSSVSALSWCGWWRIRGLSWERCAWGRDTPWVGCPFIAHTLTHSFLSQFLSFGRTVFLQTRGCWHLVCQQESESSFWDVRRADESSSWKRWSGARAHSCHVQHRSARSNRLLPVTGFECLYW